jgi:hypothetical protein
LLQEIGAAVGNGHSADAEKMLRLRARRKLSSMLRDVSAVVLVRYRRVAELVQGLLPSYEGLLPTTTCVICLLVALSGGMVLETPTPAEAQQIRSEHWVQDVTTSTAGTVASTPAPAGLDVATTLKPDVSSMGADSAARTPQGAKQDPQDPTSPTVVSGSGGVPVPIPRTPPLPGSGSGDQPTEVRADGAIPEQPEAPSDDDGAVQLPVPLPDAISDPLDAAADL